MRVVHVCTFSGGGTGAARASLRIHEGLRGLGIHSQVLTLVKHTPDSAVRVVGTATAAARARRSVAGRFEGLVRRASNGGRNAVFTSGLVGACSLETEPEIQRADAIILYWVGFGFLSNATIGALLHLGKPVLWRLSDMWAFTGGCHYSGGCERYRERCGACPQLRVSANFDLSRIVWHSKRKWDTSRLTVVCPSRWMAENVRRSSILGRAAVRVIPTGVDTASFTPGDRQAARQKLGVPADARVILFGAAAAHSNTRKGGHLLREALSKLAAHRPEAPVHLVVFGAAESLGLPFPTLTLSHMDDDTRLAEVYQAADVFVAPSMEDNLPNTALEAMASGLPVIAFDVGGMRDAVIHERTGLAIEPFDTDALADAIERVVGDRALCEQLGRGARALAQERFDQHVQALAYRELLSECVRPRR